MFYIVTIKSWPFIIKLPLFGKRLLVRNVEENLEVKTTYIKREGEEMQLDPKGRIFPLAPSIDDVESPTLNVEYSYLGTQRTIYIPKPGDHRKVLVDGEMQTFIKQENGDWNQLLKEKTYGIKS